MRAKDAREVGPFLALFIAILGVMGITLWLYDRYSRARVVRLINDMGYVSSLYER